MIDLCTECKRPSCNGEPCDAYRVMERRGRFFDCQFDCHIHKKYNQIATIQKIVYKQILGLDIAKTPENTAFSRIFRGSVLGVPCAIRTRGLQSRSLTLYPAELMAHIGCIRGCAGLQLRACGICIAAVLGPDHIISKHRSAPVRRIPCRRSVPAPSANRVCEEAVNKSIIAQICISGKRFRRLFGKFSESLQRKPR